MILKMSNDKNLVITAHGNTFEDENNAEVIKVLLPKAINKIDVESCTVLLNFVNSDGYGEPIDLTEHLKEYSDEYYTAEIPMTRMITGTPGEVDFWIEVISTSEELLARTDEVPYIIKHHKDISGSVPEERLSALYEILQKLDDLYNNGGINKEELRQQIFNAVKTYLDENPISIEETDPTVPAWAKNPTPPTYQDVGTYSVEQIDSKLASKANKSDTLSGYGITDSYTKDVVDQIGVVANSGLEKANSALSGLNEKQSKSDDLLQTKKKTIVDAINEILNKYDMIPQWAKQPNKPTYTADEVGTYSKEYIETTQASLISAIGTVDSKVIQIGKDVSKKADKADIYTKEQIDDGFIVKSEFIVETQSIKNNIQVIEASLSNKATKSTTLAGYGIEDSYTTNEVDNLLQTKTEEIAQFIEENNSILRSLIQSNGTKIGNLEEQIGDIDSALDSIIAIQESLIGGDS